MNSSQLPSCDDKIMQFEKAVKQYCAQEIPIEKLISLCHQQGVHNESRTGFNKVSIRISEQGLIPNQLIAIAYLIKSYSHSDFVFIENQTEIQIPLIPLDDTPDVLRKLAEFGLTTRQGNHSLSTDVQSIYPEKKATVCATIYIPEGKLTVKQLRCIAVLMECEGLTNIHATQYQNLVIYNIPEGRVDALRQGILELGLMISVGLRPQ